jgi:hypothetical protein
VEPPPLAYATLKGTSLSALRLRHACSGAFAMQAAGDGIAEVAPPAH